jgi:hypothetical protein
MNFDPEVLVRCMECQRGGFSVFLFPYCSPSISSSFRAFEANPEGGPVHCPLDRVWKYFWGIAKGRETLAPGNGRRRRPGRPGPTHARSNPARAMSQRHNIRSCLRHAGAASLGRPGRGESNSVSREIAAIHRKSPSVLLCVPVVAADRIIRAFEAGMKRVQSGGES